MSYERYVIRRKRARGSAPIYLRRHEGEIGPEEYANGQREVYWTKDIDEALTVSEAWLAVALVRPSLCDTCIWETVPLVEGHGPYSTPGVPT